MSTSILLFSHGRQNDSHLFLRVEVELCVSPRLPRHKTEPGPPACLHKTSGWSARRRRTSPTTNSSNHHPSSWWRKITRPQIVCALSGKPVAVVGALCVCMVVRAISHLWAKRADEAVSILIFGPMSDTACSHPNPDSAGPGTSSQAQAKRLCHPRAPVSAAQDSLYAA